MNVAFGGKPIEQGDEDSVPYLPLDKVPSFQEKWVGPESLGPIAQRAGVGETRVHLTPQGPSGRVPKLDGMNLLLI